MDLWSVHVKNITGSPFLIRNSFSEKPISWNCVKARPLWLGVEDGGRVFEFRDLNLRPPRRVSSDALVVRATGKKNNNNNHGNSSNSSSSSGMLFSAGAEFLM